jgi:hypothetical protein
MAATSSLMPSSGMPDGPTTGWTKTLNLAARGRNGPLQRIYAQQGWPAPSSSGFNTKGAHPQSHLFVPVRSRAGFQREGIELAVGCYFDDAARGGGRGRSWPYGLYKPIVRRCRGLSGVCFKGHVKHIVSHNRCICKDGGNCTDRLLGVIRAVGSPAGEGARKPEGRHDQNNPPRTTSSWER